jgi:hypothetical protein
VVAARPVPLMTGLSHPRAISEPQRVSPQVFGCICASRRCCTDVFFRTAASHALPAATISKCSRIFDCIFTDSYSCWLSEFKQHGRNWPVAISFVSTAVASGLSTLISCHCFQLRLISANFSRHFVSNDYAKCVVSSPTGLDGGNWSIIVDDIKCTYACLTSDRFIHCHVVIVARVFRKIIVYDFLYYSFPCSPWLPLANSRIRFPILFSLPLHHFMYVRMFVCTYVCMYAYMYVCIESLRMMWS